MTDPATLQQRRQDLTLAGVKHKGRPVPFGIGDQLVLAPQTVEGLRQAGNVVGRYFRALNTLMTRDEYAPLRQTVKELQLLNRPEAARLNTIAPDVSPCMFRLDVMIEEDEGFETSELECLFGGIGYTVVMRDVLFPDPSKGLGIGFARMLRYLSGGNGARCSTVTINVPVLKPYLEDIELFARSVRQTYPNFDLVFSEDLRLDEHGNLVSVDNPEPIRFVHRFFEIYHGVNGDVPNFEVLIEAYRRGTARDLPSLKQFTEEKLTMGLVWIPQLVPFFQQELGTDGLEAIRAIVPRTYRFATDLVVDWQGQKVAVTEDVALCLLRDDLNHSAPLTRQQAVTYTSTSHLIAPNKRSEMQKALQRMPRTIDVETYIAAARETQAVLTLARLPNDKRQFVLKLSGFSEGAAEAKSVVLLAGMKQKEAQQAIDEALASGDIYVLQEATQHRRFPVRGLFPVYKDYRNPDETHPERAEMREFAGFARVEPHYFQTGPDEWAVGDISVTLAPDRKVHGRTDGLITFVDF